jgi:hypothetical protein
MRRIPNAAGDTLTDFMLDYLARGAVVHIDVGRLKRHRPLRFRHVVPLATRRAW